jgi:hypothetical protein
MRVFCGYDAREDIGYRVFEHSLRRHAKVPLELSRLDSQGLPVGTNEFTFSRFLVPHFSGYEGWSLFADASDMLCMTDIGELLQHCDPQYAVLVVKHSYKTRNPIKYIGTEMECPNVDYPRKNWASLMLMNCGHRAWRGMTPGWIHVMADKPRDLLGMRWMSSDNIGSLPDKWNRLVDEGQSVEGAAILHWTAGIPGFDHYRNAKGAEHWHAERDKL